MAAIIEDATTAEMTSTTLEQTLLEIVIPESATRWLSSLFWFATNLTETTVFRVYIWNVDESIYELVDGITGIGGTLTWDPATSTGRCLRFIASSILTYGSKLKLTAQSSIAEGSSKTVRVSFGYLA